MPIARITGPGLAAIAIAVALLWGCVIGERVMVRRALAERARILRDIQLLQRRQRAEPVSLPSPHSRRSPRVGETGRRSVAAHAAVLARRRKAAVQ